jgi:hypothetical protein
MSTIRKHRSRVHGDSDATDNLHAASQEDHGAIEREDAPTFIPRALRETGREELEA